ncbi:sigma-54-dependent transcriptional regulator [Kordiimonas aquimaris]|uniref:sigma-54-dependent transcriptional regulator n=1 Tax=Kordiimonas aquimaris TaxID=707591 RepID=UPI0021CFACBD|nr:sigma-54 dependent transcriptional regulator [Kordiimonas aquimaris]
MDHTEQKTVLIVEDEITQAVLLEGIVKRAGYDVILAESGVIALDKLAHSAKTPAIDIVVLDLVMPGMDGIEVLKRLRKSLPNLPVIMLTGHSSITTVVDAMRAGATDFIVKPASAERIRAALKAGLETQAFVGEIEPVISAQPDAGFENLIGDSAPMKRAVTLAKKAARASIPVLIDGESGVGKEVFARAIHAASDRANLPFVAVNCGAIPENLVESILFGHEKGAFTGATETRVGKFEEANGGTLFLDEVGELPLDIQVKLLRALQEKEIDPVGSRGSISVDIRIISATNRNLPKQIASGNFREDLFYRLNVFPITLPSLKDRRDDIPALTAYFLQTLATLEDLPKRRLSPAAASVLMAYDWPGNIRQLQNALFRAIILSEHEELTPEDFLHVVSSSAHQQEQVSSQSRSSTPEVSQNHTHATVQLLDADGHARTLGAIECDVIKMVLDRYNGKMAEVARRLNIGRSTLYRKIEEYGLKR